MKITRTGRAISALAIATLIGSGANGSPVSAATAAPVPLVVGAQALPSGVGSAGTTDLSAGTLDWLHATGDGTEQKKGADALTLGTLHPQTPLATLTDSPVGFSWSDGSTSPSATNVTSGAVYRYDLTTVGDTTGYDAGYRLTVASDDTVRQLILVSGIWQADARFSVTPLGGGQPVYSTTLTAAGTAAARTTTVTLRPGQGAVISSVLKKTRSVDGNVSFMGASLRSLGDGPQLTADATPATLDLTKTGTLDWLHLDGGTVERSRSGDGSLGVANRDAGGTITRQGDNPVSYSWSNGITVASQPGTTTGGVFLARSSDFSAPSGWDLTVAKATDARTLRFVAGAWQASATLSVTFDGKTVPTLTDTSLTAGGSAGSHFYTVTIPAGSSATISAQLTATTESGGNGNVTLAGVTIAAQDFRAALNDQIAQAKAADTAGTETAIADQLRAETQAAVAVAADHGASAAAIRTEFYLLQAAVSAVRTSVSTARFSYQSSPGLTSSFGWEGDKDAPIAFVDGSYRLRDHDNTMITFGVPDVPGKIGWRNAEGYLPSFISDYAKDGLTISVQNFADVATVAGNRLEVAYSRMSVTNTTRTPLALPRVSAGLIGLTNSTNAKTVAPGKTVVRDYAVGADRFGGTFAWPTDVQLRALGSFDRHYSHMRSYWNNRLSAIADITALPDKRLINAYKAGFIYTLIIRDDVDGQKQLHVGENGYDEMFDHDTIGIVSTLLTMGDFTNAKDYLATLPAQLQYQDAKWKYSVPYAIYLQRTGDSAFVRDHFTVISNNTHSIETDREDGGEGIIKITNAIDSDGHWTVDNWSALYGLSTYKYLAQKLGNTGEAKWAQAEYDSLLAAATAKLIATQKSKNLNYIPMALDQANEEGPRSDPRDANWASMFLFGGWAWGSYLYGMTQSGSMLDQIDQTYTYGIDRRAQVSDSPFNFGGYPHGYYSSAYNAGYGAAALRGEHYRDIGIKAYQFMIDHSQSGPFGWWEGVDYPKTDSPWSIDHASGGGGSNQHMWGQAMGSNVLFDSLISLKSDGSVIIGRGLPADWVAPGQKVALENFPVADGGRLGYSITAKQRSVTVSFSGDVRKVSGTSIQLLALKNNIGTVKVQGASAKKAIIDRAAGTVTVPKGATTVTITLGTPPHHGSHHVGH